MASKFDRVKSFYDRRNPNGDRLWDIDRVRDAVTQGWITPAQFEEITGEAYE